MNEQITSAAELDALPDDARMDAYYYSFDRTGVGPVDAILSAVAVAGKGSHHTDGWRDVSDYYYKERPGLPDADSGMDLIQLTANQSADQIRAALCPDQPQRVQPSREDVARGIEAYLKRATIPAALPWQEPTGVTPLNLADAVLALFAQQPTVAEVKAEALREYAGALGLALAGADPDDFTGYEWVLTLLRNRADGIEAGR